MIGFTFRESRPRARGTIGYEIFATQLIPEMADLAIASISGSHGSSAPTTRGERDNSASSKFKQSQNPCLVTIDHFRKNARIEPRSVELRAEIVKGLPPVRLAHPLKDDATTTEAAPVCAGFAGRGCRLRI
jgi:hypothetical protein